MPQITYRGNLSAATFPMTVAQAGRSVIIPGPDNYFDRRVDPDGSTKDAGIPQAIYMENVLPTSGGYQSVGYDPTSNVFPSTGNVNLTITVSVSGSIYGVTQRTPIVLAFVSNTEVRCNFSDAQYSGGWIAAIIPAGYSTPNNENDISFAYVRGVTYCWIKSAQKLYTLSCATLGNPQVTFTDVTGTIAGIAVANIGWITSAFNYLICIDIANQSIRWSSTTTPTDFVVSLVSGAGSETPTGLQSQMNFLLAHPTGFLIYTDSNVIAASYTGNARYPWKFKEISGSTGVSNRWQISLNYLNNSEDIHFVVDDAGKIQAISGLRSETIAPEVTNYLERSKIIDNFDSTTNTFSVQHIPDNFYPDVMTFAARRKISFLLSRYIIISYGLIQGSYTNAIWYDTTLQRFGKLKIAHNSLWSSENYIYFISFSNPVATRLSYDIYDYTAAFSGVLILGKFQYVRSRFMRLEEIEIESEQSSAVISANAIPMSPNFTLAILPSLDGKNFNTAITPTLVSNTNELRSYKCHNTAMNHSLVLKGAFDVNTVQLKFVPDGKR